MKKVTSLLLSFALVAAPIVVDAQATPSPDNGVQIAAAKKPVKKTVKKKASTKSSKAASSKASIAPSSSCTIKGNISATKEKIFHVIGCPNYGQTVIDTTKGERMFCSEQEAKDAGWRKALNCP